MADLGLTGCRHDDPDRSVDDAEELTRPGAVLVLDNVVRGGRVADAAASDPDAAGARAALAALASDERWDATALQTLGPKGWDGIAIALRR